MRLDKIKLIRDYWKAGHNMGEMCEQFPDVDRSHINALTFEDSDGKDFGLTLVQYQEALEIIPPGSPYTVIGPIIRLFAGR